MPTQEERLSLLEQTVTAFSRDIRDISHNETMLLGMAMKQQEQTREIRSSLASLSEHLDTFEHSVNGRFETLEGRLGSFEHSVNGRFEALEGRLGSFEQGVTGRFGALETTLHEHTAVLAKFLHAFQKNPNLPQ